MNAALTHFSIRLEMSEQSNRDNYLTLRPQQQQLRKLPKRLSLNADFGYCCRLYRQM